MENNYCNKCGECCKKIAVDFSKNIIYRDGIQTLDDNLKFSKAKVIPVRLVNGGIPSVDSANTAIKKLNEYADLDFPKTGVKFDANGEYIK